MMLRNRSVNATRQGEKPSGLPQPVKRHAIEPGNPKEDAKRKRAGLAELSNAMSNSLLIDSCKKSMSKEPIKSRPAVRRTVSESSNDARAVVPGGRLESKKKLPTVREFEPSVPDKDESVTVIEPEEVHDPAPHYNFDEENMADPYSISEYASDIFRYYISREKQFHVGEYLKNQPALTEGQRAAIADWMVEAQETFELNHETLYLAVKLTDIYLSRAPPITKNELQLVGATATFIASKFDERSPPLIDDFVCIFEDTFSRNDVIEMEMKMLKTIGFDLGSPLSYRFLRRYGRVKKMDMSELTLARYILETSLLFYKFVPVSENLMAAATLLLAIRMKKIGDWDAILEKYSGFKKEEVEPLMWQLNHMMWLRPKMYPLFKTVFNKYSHEVFFSSTRVPLLEDRFADSEIVGPPAELCSSK